MNILFVEIENAGIGTDSTIGLFSGNLKWSSSGYGGYSSGIIDQKTVSRVISAMNITRGGGFGGFQGTVSIGAYSKNLVSAVIEKTITLIGKNLKIKIQISEDGSESLYESQRFICPITSYRISNEGLITIDCDTSKAFDRKKIGGITVTKEMAFDDSDNVSIGKNVISVIGETVDFPLVYIPSNNLPIAISLLRGNENLISVTAPKIWRAYNTYSQKDYNTSGNERKGATLLMVSHIKQEDEGNIKIALSFNGEFNLFGSDSFAYLEEINSIYTGMKIKVVRGVGDGAYYPIVKCTLEEIGNSGNYTIWFEIGCTDIDSLKESGSFGSSAGFTYSGVGKFAPTDAFGVKTSTYRFNAIYEYNGNPSNVYSFASDVSFVSIIGADNIYVVDASFVLQNSKIIGVSDEDGSYSEIEISADLIRVIYETEKWKLIQVVVGKTVVESDDSFALKAFNANDVIVANDYPSLNTTKFNYGTSYNQSINDSFTDGQTATYVSSLVYTDTYDNGERFTKAGITNTIFYEIEDIIDGKDLSNGNSELILIPRIDAMWDMDTIPLVSPLSFKIEFSLEFYIVGEGNVILAKQENTKYSKTFSTEISPQIEFYIDPENKRIRFHAENAYGYSFTDDDYVAFDSMSSSANISQILKALSSRQIRGVLVYFRMTITGDGVELHSQSSFFKRIGQLYSCKTYNVKKGSLYIRSQRDNGAYTVNTPAGMIKYLADKNEVSIDSTSFLSVISKHQSLYDDVSNSGQYNLDSQKSFSDVVDEICKQSMTAVFQSGDGKFYAKWFADDDGDTETVYTFTDIEVGSLSIDKPSGGYVSTDFVFSIIEKTYKNPEELNINSSSDITTFPESGFKELGGLSIQNGVGGYTLFNSSVSMDGTIVIGISNSSFSIFDIQKDFPKGTRWAITCRFYGDAYDTIVYAKCTSISPRQEVGQFYIGFSDLSYEIDDKLIGGEVKAISSICPNEKWRDYVSGSFVTDYTTAKNIWDHAQNARIAIGVESKMSTEYTTLKQPVWGDDFLAIMNWILYTVIHNTREKTVITFRHKMTPQTILLKKMDYVKFQFGPYASINGIAKAGVKGWICEIEEDFSKMEFTFTILTSISDTDALIIDERLADGSILIDENPVSTTFYDEGRLA